MFPIIAFFAWKYGGVQKIDWLLPVFVFTTVFTLGTGPAQAFTAYKLGAPKITRHKRWFFMYVLLAAVLYNEMKNTIGRVAQIKELMRERAWKVTPRSVD